MVGFRRSNVSNSKQPIFPFSYLRPYEDFFERMVQRRGTWLFAAFFVKGSCILLVYKQCIFHVIKIESQLLLKHNVKKLTAFIDLSIVLRLVRRPFSCLVRASKTRKKKHRLKYRSFINPQRYANLYLYLVIIFAELTVHDVRFLIPGPVHNISRGSR